MIHQLGVLVEPMPSTDIGLEAKVSSGHNCDTKCVFDIGTGFFSIGDRCLWTVHYVANIYFLSRFRQLPLKSGWRGTMVYEPDS